MLAQQLKLTRSALLYLTISGGLLGPYSRAAHAQVERQIVIGDLVGRTDVRELKILTKQGLLPVISVGNGKPFTVFKRSENRIVVRFHKSADIGRFNPNTIVFKSYTTERSLISALILDEVDAAELESEESAREVASSNGHFLPYPQPLPPNTVKMIIYNHRRAPFDNPEIRVALSYGINHGQLLKKVLGNKASIAKGPYDDASPLYASGLKSYKYKPRLALQNLHEAGWTDSDGDGILDKNGHPFTLTLFYPKGLRIDEAISRMVKINLIKLGIDVKPKPLSRRELNNKLVAGDFQAVLTDHVFKENIESLSAVFSADGEQNYSGYRSPKLENYFRFYNETDDRKQRKILIQGIQTVVNQEQPVTFLYFKWLTHYLVNVEKFDNFRHTEGPNRGNIRPFEEWIIKKRRE